MTELGGGWVDEAMAYVLQQCDVVLDTHGVAGACIYGSLVVLDSECAARLVSGEVAVYE